MSIKDFFNKEIKQNICNQDELNGKYSIMAPVDWRNDKEVYKEFYTPEQIKYLFEHGLLRKYIKTGASWERPCIEYWEFTERGQSIRIWHNSSLWYLFKTYVLKTYWWRFRWHDLRIKMGHHYEWQDYDGVDIYE